MFIVKLYRSIGVILVLGGVLYLFMAIRINNGIGVGDVVLSHHHFSTDESQNNTITFRMHQLRSSANSATTDDDIIKLNSSHNIYNDQDQNITIPINDEINSSIYVEVNRIVQVTSKSPSDLKANLSNSVQDSRTENTTVLSDEKIVIIIAYMRTGSTLTASLFQEYPGTFYVFEPIRGLSTKFKGLRENNQTTFHYLHGEKRKTIAEKYRKTTGIMCRRKLYSSICVIIALGVVVHLLIYNGIDVGDVVVSHHHVPTDESQNNTRTFQMHQLRSSSANSATVDEDIIKLNSSQNIYNDQDQNITIPINDEINSSISVEVNRIVQVTSKSPSDVKANLSNNVQDSRTENTTVLSDEKIVIIIAYMRTGSTLTASLFQEYPGTFYVFEPIRGLCDKFKGLRENNQTTFHYLHGENRNYTVSQRKQVIMDEVTSWLTCKLDSLGNESLNDGFHTEFTKIMKTFYYCSKGRTSRAARMHMSAHPQNIDTCLKTDKSSCQKSPLRLLKFIRFRMEEAAKLLPVFPNMKIIHLLRDPRGILNSRLKVKTKAPFDYKTIVTNLCTYVKDDLKYSKRILQQYPDRLKIVQYEDMAENPMETARSLLDFAGVEFLKNMQNFMHKQTNSSRDSCAYCTQRRNSSLTAHKWRTQLEPKYAHFIDGMCKISNSVLGYLPLTSVNEMRNQSIHTRKSVDVYKELLTNVSF